MDEFELIERYFRRAVPGVAVGIGDDGAIVMLPEGHDLVVVVDSLVAGVHFPDDMEAADIGHRALAVNLSDIAAMGATPAWMTLALTMPAADPDWLSAFAGGLFGLAERYGVALIGGDTTRGALTITVQVLGHVPAGLRMLRSGARPGDWIHVSGTLGDAAAGLHHAAAEEEPGRILWRRFVRPEPRVQLGLAIVGRASAAIDVSDGLVADLGHICEASGTGAILEMDSLPLSTALLQSVGRERGVELALTGGDDYELCFTAPPDAEIPGNGITRIGTITEERGIRIRHGGDLFTAPASGYRHFGTDP